MTSSTFAVTLDELRTSAAVDPKEAKRLARAEATLLAIAKDEAKHTCGRTVAGALTCKRCLSRKAKVDLPAYLPRVITAENLAAQLAEYSGEAPAQRAKEEAERAAAFAVDVKRLCECGHPFTEHNSRDPKANDHGYGAYGTWGRRPDCRACRYGSKECYSFREVDPRELELCGRCSHERRAHKSDTDHSRGRLTKHFCNTYMLEASGYCECYGFQEPAPAKRAIRTLTPATHAACAAKPRKAPAAPAPSTKSSAARVAAYRERHQAANLCERCPAPALEGRKYCADCAAEAKARVAAWRAARKAS